MRARRNYSELTRRPVKGPYGAAAKEKPALGRANRHKHPRRYCLRHATQHNNALTRAVEAIVTPGQSPKPHCNPLV